MSNIEKVIELIPPLSKINEEYFCCNEEDKNDVNILNQKLYELFSESDLDEEI